MNTLEEIRAALVKSLGDEARYRLVSARLTLRTGINLTSIPEHLSQDATAARKIMAALEAMGLSLLPDTTPKDSSGR